jgi:hypothetical protein
MKIIACLFFIGFTCDLAAQNRTISGKVIGSEFRTKRDKTPYEFWVIPGAKIFSKDSLLGVTNEKGEFKIEISEKVNEISIGWFGMYPDKIHISGNCDYLEVLLLPDVIYDFVTLKKEERLRKKDRAILPLLYEKAFEQGIFGMKVPCR